MERLSMMGATCRAIVGEPAPRFTSKDVVEGRIRDVSLLQYMNDKQWLILLFYPNAWSFICPTEIIAFNYRVKEFTARNCQVIFASTDSEHILKAWNGTDKEEGGLGGVRLPLLSDQSHRMSRDYGVLIEESGIAQRATFIVDPSGIIRSTSQTDVHVGRSVDETLRTLEALQFTDDFGEGCPSGWKLGEQGIRLKSVDDTDNYPVSPRNSALLVRPPSQHDHRITDLPVGLQRFEGL